MVRRATFDLAVYENLSTKHTTPFLHFIRNVVTRMIYLQDQHDYAIPTILQYVSKQLNKWERRIGNPAFVDATQQVRTLDLRREQLFDRLDAIQRELEYGSNIMSYVTDASTDAAQVQIRRDDDELRELRMRFERRYREDSDNEEL